MQNKIFKAKPGLQQTNNKEEEEEKRQCRSSFNQDRRNVWGCGVCFYLIWADVGRLGNPILIRGWGQIMPTKKYDILAALLINV